MTEAVWNTRKEAFNQPCFLHGMCAPYTSSLGNQQLHIIHMVCSFICCKLHNIQPAQQQGQTYTQYTLNQGSVLQPPPPQLNVTTRTAAQILQKLVYTHQECFIYVIIDTGQTNILKNIIYQVTQFSFCIQQIITYMTWQTLCKTQEKQIY